MQQRQEKTSSATSVATHCPYCAFQCGMLLGGSPQRAWIEGDRHFPVNRGGLCLKGWTSPETLAHPERLRTPLKRQPDGSLQPVSWDEALESVVQHIRAAQQRYGREAVGVFGSGALTNEEAYLLGKFARLALATSQIDYNGRFCMSSAAEAMNRAFGLDRGLPFPLEDLAQAEVILLAGSNIAETMPPLMQYLERQQQAGGLLITVDPRQSITARSGQRHLQLTPGSDAALANGLLHILIRDGLLDEEYIAQRTSNFAAAQAMAAAYWPERVERLTGVPERELTEVAHLLAQARSAMVLTGRGAEQQRQGVTNVLAYINVALALGLVGRPGSGFGSLTGQGNGQGGREHGQKANQLPGYRRIDDPAARTHIARVWGVDERELPGPGRSAYEMLASLGRPGGVRCLFVMGSNLVVSAPNALQIEERLAALDSLIVCDFFLSETARLASVVLPVTQWAEEEGTLTNLEGRVIHRRRVFSPPAGVWDEITLLCELARRLGKGQYFPFSKARDVFEELRRASVGGLADYAGISYEKIDAQQGVFWPCPAPDHPGTPRLFTEGFPTSDGRARFHVTHYQGPAEEPDRDYPLYLSTGRTLAHYQSGSQTRRIAQLQALSPEPLIEIHPTTASECGLNDGDLALLSTRRASMQGRIRVNETIREDTLFVPFHWGDAQAVNRLTNPALDPVSRMPEFKVCAARIERLENP
ncbi:molybdopterin oxidoreductase family protein [Thermogemmatispora sp.]|uniref:molybdopterin oxidoreductase family protein n=1 Tax=Thermogemmatispora sp. TaxID=1968838 RepID=UPI0035E42DFC